MLARLRAIHGAGKRDGWVDRHQQADEAIRAIVTHQHGTAILLVLKRCHVTVQADGLRTDVQRVGADIGQVEQGVVVKFNRLIGRRKLVDQRTPNLVIDQHRALGCRHDE